MALLREQRGSGFADIAGTRASLTAPVSDRLLTRIIASRLPSSLPMIRELDLRAVAGNQLVISLRAGPSFLPAFTIRLAIDEQPVLPSSPVLVLRIVSQGLAAMGNTALRFLQALPPGLRLDGDRLYVNLATLLERYGAEGALQHLSGLEISTTEGRVVVSARSEF